MATQINEAAVSGGLAVITASLQGREDRRNPLGLQQLIQQGPDHQLFNDGAGNLSVAASPTIVMLMRAPFGGLDALVIAVDSPRS
ncbi:hypothetical protein J4G43_006670 [Bradyrhizobium barranii subsp. barranii]|uniref:Uncharacterized protein n=1 Tax=Bradyrhizobium barranii subsp. barranii TaxID=2823807 RepID=A0A9X9Y205_9BRAD|nr:hypothetical protein [Bradyrhizobium barranii]UEM13949.1 hypothetical protein J4G43_006670 [Bradyrhizobium barranii subsp. barranii]